jgi:PAS domain S-box-containing protein
MEFAEFLRKFFGTSDRPPRWQSGNWSSLHGWLYIISDLLIWSAFFAIPLIILKFISRKSNAKFIRAYFLFAAFILACCSTHLLDAIIFWLPVYWFNTLVRFLTGIISWTAVLYTIKILPAAISLKTHEELEKEIADRKQEKSKLISLNKQLNEAQDIAKIGHWQWEVNQNKLSWSESLFKIYGFVPENGEMNYDDFINRVHPDDRSFVNDAIQEALLTKEFSNYIHRIVLDNGTIKVMQAKGEVVINTNGEVVRMIGTGQDITEQHLSQQQLLNKTYELETANIELKKFAYIASHDLQEPLRKILTFVSLLERDAKESFSEKSIQYINKITHSATRMQRLIEDILRFSNLKSNDEVFEKTELKFVLDQVLSDMEVLIENSNAQITTDKLAKIEAVPSQMGQLFQNLLSNAIKFKKEDQPAIVEISSKIVNGFELSGNASFDKYIKNLSVNHRIWTKEYFAYIQVTDNGIGFDPAYSERIFEIFQRLHTNKSYTGTGIGLAICKKIVDNHHGTIVASSSKNNGATFTIILPVSQKNFIK